MEALQFDIRGNHVAGDIHGEAVFGDWNIFCKGAVGKSGLEVLAGKSHRFKNGAQAAFYVLSESSFIGIVSPCRNFAIADCFTCGPKGKPQEAIHHIRDGFQGAAQFTAHEILRGDVPEYGIIRPQATGLIVTTIADVIYDGLIREEDASRLFHGTIADHVGAKNMEDRSYEFTPQGITHIVVFETDDGEIGTADMHTYSEYTRNGEPRSFVAYTVTGPATLAFNIVNGITGLRPIEAANMPTFARQNLAQPILQAA